MLARAVSMGKNAATLLKYSGREKQGIAPAATNRIEGFDSDLMAKSWQYEASGYKAKSQFECVHHIISFHSSENVEPQQALELAEEYCVKVFGSRDCVIDVHQDGKGGMTHAHIVAQILDKNGLPFKQHNQHIRAMEVCKAIAKEHNLIEVEHGKNKISKTIAPNALTTQLKREIDDAIKLSKGDLIEFKGLLKDKNIKMEILKHRKTGESYGVRFKMQGSPPISGSQLGEQYKFKSIISRLENQLEKSPIIKVEKDIYANFRGKIRAAVKREKDPSKANAIAADIIKDYSNLGQIDKTILQDRIRQDLESKAKQKSFELSIMRHCQQIINPPVPEQTPSRDSIIRKATIAEIVKNARKQEAKNRQRNQSRGKGRSL